MGRIYHCVNALQRAISISTKMKKIGMNTQVVRVNALQRAISISTFMIALVIFAIVIMCQCPSTGNLHFYGGNFYEKYFEKSVSMPFNGQSPFLLDPPSIIHAN